MSAYREPPRPPRAQPPRASGRLVVSLFLVGFLAVVGLAVVAGVAVRRRESRAPSSPLPLHEPSPSAADDPDADHDADHDAASLVALARLLGEIQALEAADLIMRYHPDDDVRRLAAKLRAPLEAHDCAGTRRAYDAVRAAILGDAALPETIDRDGRIDDWPSQLFKVAGGVDMVCLGDAGP